MPPGHRTISSHLWASSSPLLNGKRGRTAMAQLEEGVACAVPVRTCVGRGHTRGGTKLLTTGSSGHDCTASRPSGYDPGWKTSATPLLCLLQPPPLRGPLHSKPAKLPPPPRTHCTLSLWPSAPATPLPEHLSPWLFPSSSPRRLPPPVPSTCTPPELHHCPTRASAPCMERSDSPHWTPEALPPWDSCLQD